MGCDIHSHAEKRDGNRWERLDIKAFEDRDYGFFGWLAGVRNYSGLTPIAAGRGFPPDASAVTVFDHKQWSGDAHSESWVGMDELLAVDYEVKQFGPTLREFLGPNYFATLKRLQDAGAERIVFWFDN